jgi:hypothetical protein
MRGVEAGSAGQLARQPVQDLARLVLVDVGQEQHRARGQAEDRVLHRSASP